MGCKRIYQGDAKARRSQAQKAWRARHPQRHLELLRLRKWKARRRQGIAPRGEISKSLDRFRQYFGVNPSEPTS